MGNVHETTKRDSACPRTDVRQLKRELEQLRREIGQRHDDAVERMRDTETRLLHALYSISHSSPVLDSETRLSLPAAT